MPSDMRVCEVGGGCGGGEGGEAPQRAFLSFWVVESREPIWEEAAPSKESHCFSHLPS